MKTRLLLFTIAILSAVATTNAHAATLGRGARANITVGGSSAELLVDEKTDPLTDRTTGAGSLKLKTTQGVETVDCTWTWGDDAVVTGAGTLHASCAPYVADASFVVVGGGTGQFPLVCGVSFSRATQAGLVVTRDGSPILSGSTTDARVWRSVDLGTCG